MNRERRKGKREIKGLKESVLAIMYDKHTIQK